MTYKEFGVTIAPANTTSTGFPIAMSSHLGGGRTIDNIANINNWQLLGDGDTSAEQKNNAIGQIWYDIHVSKYYKLDSWNVDTPIWDEFPYLKLTGGNITGNLGIGVIIPTEKLDINGTAKVQDIKVEDSVRFIDTTVEKAGMRYNTTNSTIEFYFN